MPPMLPCLLPNGRGRWPCSQNIKAENTEQSISRTLKNIFRKFTCASFNCFPLLWCDSNSSTRLTETVRTRSANAAHLAARASHLRRRALRKCASSRRQGDSSRSIGVKIGFDDELGELWNSASSSSEFEEEDGVEEEDEDEFGRNEFLALHHRCRWLCATVPPPQLEFGEFDLASSGSLEKAIGLKFDRKICYQKSNTCFKTFHFSHLCPPFPPPSNE